MDIRGVIDRKVRNFRSYIESHQVLIIISFVLLVIFLFMTYFFMKYIYYDEKDAPNFFDKANSFYEQGNYDEAIKNYKFALFLTSNGGFVYSYGHYGLACCYAQMGKYDKSEYQLKKNACLRIWTLYTRELFFIRYS